MRQIQGDDNVPKLRIPIHHHMSDGDFDLESLASYLHLNVAQVQKLAERGRLPGRRVGGQWRFSPNEIHHWLEGQIGISSDEDLMRVETALQKPRGSTPEDAITLATLLPIEAIEVHLAAKTKTSVIREMMEVAARTNWLWDLDRMEEAVISREDMHPTALENGVALLHPRRPISEILEQPFVALGITNRGIPFGGSRGVLTDIFFLICSTSDRLHLRMIARLSRLISSEGFLSALRAAEDPQEAHDLVVATERELSVG